jgi:hypothetical protein
MSCSGTPPMNTSVTFQLSRRIQLPGSPGLCGAIAASMRRRCLCDGQSAKKILFLSVALLT